MPASSTFSQDLFILSVFTLRLILEYLLDDGYCSWRERVKNIIKEIWSSLLTWVSSSVNFFKGSHDAICLHTPWRLIVSLSANSANWSFEWRLTVKGNTASGSAQGPSVQSEMWEWCSSSLQVAWDSVPQV